MINVVQVFNIYILYGVSYLSSLLINNTNSKIDLSEPNYVLPYQYCRTAKKLMVYNWRCKLVSKYIIFVNVSDNTHMLVYYT